MQRWLPFRRLRIPWCVLRLNECAHGCQPTTVATDIRVVGKLACGRLHLAPSRLPAQSYPCRSQVVEQLNIGNVRAGIEVQACGDECLVPRAEALLNHRGREFAVTSVVVLRHRLAAQTNGNRAEIFYEGGRVDRRLRILKLKIDHRY